LLEFVKVVLVVGLFLLGCCVLVVGVVVVDVVLWWVVGFSW